MTNISFHIHVICCTKSTRLEKINISVSKERERIPNLIQYGLLTVHGGHAVVFVYLYVMTYGPRAAR